LLSKPPQKATILEAVKHENRLKLHSETEITEKSKNPAFNDFLKWVRGILPKDKYQRFEQLIKTPFATLSITNEIWSELYRVFDGQNAFFGYDFTNTDLQDDFNKYLQEYLQDRQFFKTKGFECLKTGINSILVVDVPTEQEGNRPQPFYYFVEIDDVLAVDVDESTGKVEHIIFELEEREDECLYGVYDNEFYRVVQKVGDVVTLVSESAHGLGYCPASFFWDKPLKSDCEILKKSPITDSLSQLDKYLAQDTFKEHADLYSAYPIVVSMEKLCNFEGCEGGYIQEERRMYNDALQQEETTYHQIKCKACETRELIGAGTNFEYPAPQTSDSPDLSDPVKIVSADVKPLEYLTAKLSAKAIQIKSEVIGATSALINDQAINEMQVVGSFESRRNVLINIKTSFERIHKFANDTVARLRYGVSFLGSTVFYGDEFYLKDYSTLQEEYKKAKDDGEPDEELDSIYKQIIYTKYKGNKNKINRAWILYNLNPMPHNSVEEATTLKGLGAVSETDFVIKIRFNNFIARFEREQTNILFFGENLTFDKKINEINQQLAIYADEVIKSNSVNLNQ